MKLITALTLFLSLVSGAAARSTKTAPGQGFEMERYAVALRPDLATTGLSGAETIVLRATSDDLRQLAFTSNTLRIGEATTDGAPMQIASSPNAIVFTLARPAQKGARVTLRFNLTG